MKIWPVPVSRTPGCHLRHLPLAANREGGRRSRRSLSPSRAPRTASEATRLDNNNGDGGGDARPFPSPIVVEGRPSVVARETLTAPPSFLASATVAVSHSLLCLSRVSLLSLSPSRERRRIRVYVTIWTGHSLLLLPPPPPPPPPRVSFFSLLSAPFVAPSALLTYYRRT